MKRIIGFGLIALLVLTGGNKAFAAESITQAFEDFGPGTYPATKTVTFTCTAAADGSVTATAIDPSVMRSLKRGGYCLFSIESYPGSTAPKDDSDIVLNNSQSFDICGGAGTDLLDAATDRRALVKINSSVVLVPITDDLSFDATGNDVDSATFEVVFTFVVKP